MGEASHSLDRLAAATGLLLATAAALGDAEVRGPSLLPGWSRGHVLTHIARNADGLGNLLRWARTGAETPMYASAESNGCSAGAAVPRCGYWASRRPRQRCPRGGSGAARHGRRAARGAGHHGRPVW
jgi:uncharacterized protein (TIGR03083 family)